MQRPCLQPIQTLRQLPTTPSPELDNGCQVQSLLPYLGSEGATGCVLIWPTESEDWQWRGLRQETEPWDYWRDFGLWRALVLL